MSSAKIRNGGKGEKKKGKVDTQGRVRVYVRVRPFTREEAHRNELPSLEISYERAEIKVCEGRKAHEKWYKFDRVFIQSSSNKEVYNVVGRPLVNAAMTGFNGTLMAYGQTGTGKTHTMMTHDGVCVTSIGKLFHKIKLDNAHDYRVRLSYLQIYQEKLFDLLNPSSKMELVIREVPKEGIYVENLTDMIVKSPSEVLTLLKIGAKRLIFAETKMNRQSSRSHSVCQLIVEKSLKPSGRKGSPTMPKRMKHGGQPNSPALQDHKLFAPSSPTSNFHCDTEGEPLCASTPKADHLREISSSESALPTVGESFEDSLLSDLSQLGIEFNKEDNLHSDIASIKVDQHDGSPGTAEDDEELEDEEEENDIFSNMMAVEDDVVTRAKINFCDLAGSERIRKSSIWEGSRLAELQHINLSLLELGNTIHALAEGKSYIPFRNSTLTRLLQDSLGGNCKTSFLMCVSPSSRDTGETKCTLDFGQRALKISLKPFVNVEVDYKRLAENLQKRLENKEHEYKVQKEDFQRKLLTIQAESTSKQEELHSRLLAERERNKFQNESFLSEKLEYSHRIESESSRNEELLRQLAEQQASHNQTLDELQKINKTNDENESLQRRLEELQGVHQEALNQLDELRNTQEEELRLLREQIELIALAENAKQTCNEPMDMGVQVASPACDVAVQFEFIAHDVGIQSDLQPKFESRETSVQVDGLCHHEEPRLVLREMGVQCDPEKGPVLCDEEIQVEIPQDDHVKSERIFGILLTELISLQLLYTMQDLVKTCEEHSASYEQSHSVPNYPVTRTRTNMRSATLRPDQAKRLSGISDTGCYERMTDRKTNSIRSLPAYINDLNYDRQMPSPSLSVKSTESLRGLVNRRFSAPRQPYESHKYGKPYESHIVRTTPDFERYQSGSTRFGGSLRKSYTMDMIRVCNEIDSLQNASLFSSGSLSSLSDSDEEEDSLYDYSLRTLDRPMSPESPLCKPRNRGDSFNSVDRNDISRGVRVRPFSPELNTPTSRSRSESVTSRDRYDISCTRYIPSRDTRTNKPFSPELSLEMPPRGRSQSVESHGNDSPSPLPDSGFSTLASPSSRSEKDRNSDENKSTAGSPPRCNLEDLSRELLQLNLSVSKSPALKRLGPPLASQEDIVDENSSLESLETLKDRVFKLRDEMRNVKKTVDEETVNFLQQAFHVNVPPATHETPSRLRQSLDIVKDELTKRLDAGDTVSPDVLDESLNLIMLEKTLTSCLNMLESFTIPPVPKPETPIPPAVMARLSPRLRARTRTKTQGIQTENEITKLLRRKVRKDVSTCTSREKMVEISCQTELPNEMSSPCMSPVSFITTSPLLSSTPSITDTDLPNSNDQSLEYEDVLVSDLVEALERKSESPVFLRERVIEPDGASVSTQEPSTSEPVSKEQLSEDEVDCQKRKKKMFPLFMCLAPRLSKRSSKRKSHKKKKKDKMTDSQLMDTPVEQC